MSQSSRYSDYTVTTSQCTMTSQEMTLKRPRDNQLLYTDWSGLMDDLFTGDTVYMIESPHDSSSGICSAEEHHSPSSDSRPPDAPPSYHSNAQLLAARAQRRNRTTTDEDDSDVYDYCTVRTGGHHGNQTTGTVLSTFSSGVRHACAAKHLLYEQTNGHVTDRTESRDSYNGGKQTAKRNVTVHRPQIHSSATTSPFDLLPDDVITHIFQHLASNELCALARVSRRWYSLVWDAGLWTTIRLQGAGLDADRALKALTRRLSVDTPTVCVSVERVVLSGCERLTDKGVYVLARRCPELRRLEMNGCHQVTNIAMFEVVSRCVNLEHLDLSGCASITALALTPEATVQATTYGKQVYIRHLDLTDCHQLEDTGLQIIASYCSELVFLYLRRCVRISDIGVQYVANYCAHLREFSCSDCRLVTDFGVRELAKLGANLRYLSLAKCDRVSDLGVKQVARHCHRLRYLNVRGCEAVSDDTLEVVATYCRRIKSLDLGKCDVTDDGLIMLAESCVGIKKLSVKACEGVTDEGITAVAHYCRALHQLNIQDCTVSVEAYRTVKKYCRRCIIEHTNPAFY